MVGKWEIEGKDLAILRKAPPWGELAPARATERGLLFLRLIVITPLRLDKLGTRPRAPSLALRAIHLVSPRRGFFCCLRLCYVAYFTNNSDGMWSRERPDYRLRYMLRKAPLGGSCHPSG